MEPNFQDFDFVSFALVSRPSVLDQKKTFFNIPVAPCSRFVRAFRFEGCIFVFNRLLLGLNFSLFFMQHLLPS